MRLKLLRLGKAVCKGPLVDHGLLKVPWPIGDSRTIDDSIAHKLLAKYPGLFRTLKTEGRIMEKVKETHKNKVYEDKIVGPGEVK